MAKINFGFTAVQAGQKSTTLNAEPRLIANSTDGKFTVTSPVSKALNVSVGENIMFLNNISEIENAIADNNPAIVEYAQENGIDLSTPDGKKAILDHFTIWAIAKGIPQYKPNGAPIMANIRYTKEEKIAAAIEHMDELLSYDANYAKVAKALGSDDFTAEQIVDVLNSNDNEEVTNAVLSCIHNPQYHACKGSKTSSTASSTGVGCILSFTDTAIWNALKENLQDKTSKNRNFKVVMSEGDENAETLAEQCGRFETELNDGAKVVSVVAYPIAFIDDTDPISRKEK